jgi:hypothetical protein
MTNQEESHRFDFNDKIRISETSFRAALSELSELHSKAHEDNVKGKPIESSDMAACPFCSIHIAIASTPGLAAMTAELFTELIELNNLSKVFVELVTNGYPQFHALIQAIFIHGYAIGMKCGRTDAIGEFTGVK